MLELRCRPPYDPWRCNGCGDNINDAAPSSVIAGTVCDDCIDAGRFGEPFIPLTVRPIDPSKKPNDKLIVAVSMTQKTCATEYGETFPLDELVDRIRERASGELGGYRYTRLPDRLPAATIVTDNPVDLLGFLDASKAADSPFWQWQVNVRSNASAWRPEARETGKKKRIYLTPKPARFGYPARASDGQRKKQSIWWSIIDPGVFLEANPPTLVTDLLGFGLDLREWANHHKLPLLSSPSSYGSRLLRDSRFAAGWRRKVPTATNARLRSHLPGNHYQLTGKPGLTYRKAHKWDQAAAHHHAALTTRFPNANQLDAHGWFRRDPPINGTRVTTRGAIHAHTQKWDLITREAGMFTIAVKIPQILAMDALAIPAARRHGFTWQTITSVELEHLRSLHDRGVRLGDIWCCWTSPQDDDRLREYAFWSQNELQAADPKIKRWLKPVLLASYGMLAVRPSKFRNAWRWCLRPEGAIGWATRYGTLVGLERSTQTEREAQIANVLWRALIESSVRLESLEFAQRLRGAGLRPIAVYADAVFALGRRNQIDLPALNAPWRYEGEIHNLSFETPARYRSDEETRLPGTPHRGREAGQLVNPRS